MKEDTDKSQAARREFLRLLGGTVACAGTARCGNDGVVRGRCGAHAARVTTAPPYRITTGPSIAGHSASTPRSASAACAASRRASGKMTSPSDAHHFRTWVERYVYLEGEDKPHIDSQHDPVNIEASGSEARVSLRQSVQGRQGGKGVLRAQAVQSLHAIPPVCRCVRPAQPTGPRTAWCLSITNYCIGCQYCVQACPYGARFFNERKRVTDKCTWCYHRITKGLQPACVEVCPVGARVFGDLNDKQSPISQFIRDNRIHVLRPESGNAPNVYYVGIDKDVS